MRTALTAAVLVLAALGCGRASAPQTPELFRMRIAGYYWPGMYWADVAQEKGFFREAGIDAEIVDVSGDYLGSLDQVQNGRLDTNVFNIYDVLRRNLAGEDLQVVILSDTSTGADVILAKPPITGVHQLKGARVDIGIGTYQEAILSAALETARLELKDVVLVPRAGDPDASINTNVDAAVSWEPIATEAQAAGWNRIFDTSRMRGIIRFGYAFRRDYIARHPAEVQQFVNVWHRATQYMQEHPDEAYAIVGRKYGKRPAEVAALAKLESILDLEDNLRGFAYAAGPDSIYTSARKLNRLLIVQGHASRMIDATLLMEPRFVRALSSREE